jgi:hypothetical protein
MPRRSRPQTPNQPRRRTASQPPRSRSRVRTRTPSRPPPPPLPTAIRASRKNESRRRQRAPSQGGARALVPSTAYRTQQSNNIGQPPPADAASDSARYVQQLLEPEVGPLVGIPDTNSNAFSVWRTTSKYAMSTDSNGTIMFQIVPNIPEHAVGYGSSGGLWTPTPTFFPHQQAAQLQANAMSVRPVAMVAKFTGTQALATAPGDVLVGVHGTSGASYLGGYPVANTQTALSIWKRCSMAESIDQGCRIVWFPRDPNDNIFLAPTIGSLTNATLLGSNAGNSHDYNSLVFAIEGSSANTLVGQLEVITIFEAAPVPTSSFITRQVTLADTAALDTAAVMAATVSPIRHQQDSKAPPQKGVLEEVMDFGKAIAPAVMQLLALL